MVLKQDDILTRFVRNPVVLVLTPVGTTLSFCIIPSCCPETTGDNPTDVSAGNPRRNPARSHEPPKKLTYKARGEGGNNVLHIARNDVVWAHVMFL